MTLTELKYIVTLAQEQHFGKAAERCFVSQPTLSIAVKKLEEELGCVLFERSKSRVQTTSLGDEIVAQAQLVLSQTAVIKEMATAGKNHLSSSLNVGAIFTIGPFLFPHFIPELQRLAPEMPLYVEEGYTGTLRRRLRSGELDAIIISLPFSEPDIVTLNLYDEPFVVVMDKKHPLAAKKAIKPDDLNDHDVLLLGEGHCFRDQILEACPNLKLSLEKTGKTKTAANGSSLDTLRHMVASGLGITILPLSAAMASSYSDSVLVMRPFVDPVPQRTVALAWRASFPRHDAIVVLHQAINQCSIPNSGKR